MTDQERKLLDKLQSVDWVWDTMEGSDQEVYTAVLRVQAKEVVCELYRDENGVSLDLYIYRTTGKEYFLLAAGHYVSDELGLDALYEVAKQRARSRAVGLALDVLDQEPESWSGPGRVFPPFLGLDRSPEEGR